MGELAGTATGYAFVVHGCCVFSVLFGGLLMTESECSLVKLF